MFREYLKLIFRQFSRSKIYTVINIAGLTVAMTAALLIYSHVMKEWKTDRFHRNGENIYRVTKKSVYSQNWEALTPAQYGPYAKAEFPGIKEFVRVVQLPGYNVKRVDEKEYSSGNACFFTDKQFFSVFTFPLIVGNIAEDWGKDWIVVSKEQAKKYFGATNPLGQVVMLKNPHDNTDNGKEFRVVAVMDDMPAYSTLQAGWVVDFSDFEKKRFDTWGMHGALTYFLLDKNTDIPAIETGIPEMVEKNYHWSKANENQVKLQPLRDVYFHSGHISEQLLHGSWKLNLILCGITLLVLSLAFGNYLLIKLAGLNNHIGNMALQRCLGANNRHLCGQILTETAISVLIALFFSVMLGLALHPWFVGIISPKAPYSLYFSLPETVVFLLLIILLVGMTGIFLFTYAFQRINRHTIKGITMVKAGRFDLKTALSLVQMCIFCSLLCCAVVLNRQMSFIKNRQLGFDNSQVINFSWPLSSKDNLDIVRSEFIQDPDILAFSNGYELPLFDDSPGTLAVAEDPEKNVSAYMVHGDAEYLSTYRIKLLEGRNINKKSYPVDGESFFDTRPDCLREILVNRKFTEQLGLKNAVGTVLQLEKYHKFLIVGIVDDFHFEPLYEPVKPMFIVYDMPFRSYSMLVRYNDGKRQAVLDKLQKRYQDKFPNSTFSYQEYDYSQLYDRDIALVRLIDIFTLIAVFVGGMGIFAFSMFMAESRTKEVALRKINGAGEWQIVALLNRSFVVRVLVACAVGLPLAHYALTKWLEGFAYKSELSWWIYAVVTVVCVLLVIAIITWQTWRAATVNPVEALKSE